MPHKRRGGRPAKGDTVTVSVDGETITGVVKVRTKEMLAIDHENATVVVPHEAVEDWQATMSKKSRIGRPS